MTCAKAQAVEQLGAFPRDGLACVSGGALLPKQTTGGMNCCTNRLQLPALHLSALTHRAQRELFPHFDCGLFWEPLTRKKFYTLTGPCWKFWVLLSARCAIFCCLPICLFLLTLKNVPTHRLGAACQSGEMTPGAVSTTSKVLFWDQASAWVTALIYPPFLKPLSKFPSLFTEMWPVLWKGMSRGSASCCQAFASSCLWKDLRRC